jgi:hypothetical protein
VQKTRFSTQNPSKSAHSEGDVGAHTHTDFFVSQLRQRTYKKIFMLLFFSLGNLDFRMNRALGCLEIL